MAPHRSRKLPKLSLGWSATAPCMKTVNQSSSARRDPRDVVGAGRAHVDQAKLQRCALPRSATISRECRSSERRDIVAHHSLLAVRRNAAEVVDRRLVFDGDRELKARVLHAALEGAGLLRHVADAQSRRLRDGVRLSGPTSTVSSRESARFGARACVFLARSDSLQRPR